MHGIFTYIYHKIQVKRRLNIGCGPLPVTVTTRNIIYLVGDSYRSSFGTGILGGGHGPQGKYTVRPMDPLG